MCQTLFSTDLYGDAVIPMKKLKHRELKGFVQDTVANPGLRPRRSGSRASHSFKESLLSVSAPGERGGFEHPQALGATHCGGFRLAFLAPAKRPPEAPQSVHQVAR